MYVPLPSSATSHHKARFRSFITGSGLPDGADWQVPQPITYTPVCFVIIVQSIFDSFTSWQTGRVSSI